MSLKQNIKISRFDEYYRPAALFLPFMANDLCKVILIREIMQRVRINYWFFRKQGEEFDNLIAANLQYDEILSGKRQAVCGQGKSHGLYDQAYCSGVGLFTFFGKEGYSKRWHGTGK